jgi:hypothetical protein
MTKKTFSPKAWAAMKTVREATGTRGKVKEDGQGRLWEWQYECLAKADRETGKITDGANQKFRCFAASMEWRGSVRDARWHNFDALKGLSTDELVTVIGANLPKSAAIIRVHVSGDFFSESYFKAWIRVARNNPQIRFYAYTKSLNFWVRNIARIPANFKLTASHGGRYDQLIEQHSLKTAKVVFTIEEAAALGLELDHDDSHAYDSGDSFALLLHGGQRAGSKALSALRMLKGIGSYGQGAQKAA